MAVQLTISLGRLAEGALVAASALADEMPSAAAPTEKRRPICAPP